MLCNLRFIFFVQMSLSCGLFHQIIENFHFRDLCWLFCCPPCPSSITSKLAFQPPELSYELIPSTKEKYHLVPSSDAEWNLSSYDLKKIEALYATSSRGNSILCVFVRCNSKARYTILFSHGNAVDVGYMCNFFLVLGKKIKCNFFSYDYSGYGMSSGKPAEKNVYCDIDAAWNALQTKYGLLPKNIILYGQSIGTVPTVDLAMRERVAAVILHSPLMSAMRVAFPKTKRTWCCDAFLSIEKISKVYSPTLVIHGTEDDIIDITHGVRIFELCPIAVEPLWIDGAGHDDIEQHTEYLQRLKRFIHVELVNTNFDVV